MRNITACEVQEISGAGLVAADLTTFGLSVVLGGIIYVVGASNYAVQGVPNATLRLPINAILGVGVGVGLGASFPAFCNYMRWMM